MISTFEIRPQRPLHASERLVEDFDLPADCHHSHCREAGECQAIVDSGENADSPKISTVRADDGTSDGRPCQRTERYNGIACSIEASNMSLVKASLHQRSQRGLPSIIVGIT